MVALDNRSGILRGAARRPRTVGGAAHRRAFTLIELLVVIAIIAVLAGLLFPVFASARARAYQSSCISNLNQLGRGFSLYLDSWEDTFPNSWQDRASAYGELTHSWWDEQIRRYVGSDDVYHCPMNDVESFSVHQPFGVQGRKTRVVNYALNNQLLGCQASGDAFNYSSPPAEPVIANRVVDPSGTILLTEKMLDGPDHPANGPDQKGNQSEEVDVWFHIAVPGMDPGSWDLRWGVPRRLHGDRSNYLFVDGHVKSLTLRQTFEGGGGKSRNGESNVPTDSGAPPPSAPEPPTTNTPGDTGVGGGLVGASQGSQPLGMWGLGDDRYHTP